MKTVKKIIIAKYNYNIETQGIKEKLEEYARCGLILKEIKGMFWTFEKGKPQDLKYTVTYFKEASMFDSEYSDKQLTYLDYAKESGWNFVCSYNEMQIFSSDNENQVPFETDDRETLENIHSCTKKKVIPVQIMFLAIWLLNFLMRIPSFISRPSEFLANKLELINLGCCALVCIITGYSLIRYYMWLRKSKRSIELGGGILNPRTKANKIFETISIVVLYMLIAYMFVIMINDMSIAIVTISLLQVPIYIAVFKGAISIQKRLKVPAKINMIVTFLLYILTGMLYLGCIFYAVANFDLSSSEKEYRVVSIEMPNSDPYEYKLYNDKLPLTSEDLYGENDYENYSYESNVSETFLLKKEEFRQNSLPSKDKAPEIEYTIYTSKYKFVLNGVCKELMTHDNSFFDKHSNLLENGEFNANYVYEFYYADSEKSDKNYNGEYLLVYDDKIIYLNVEDKLSDSQIDIVVEKLGLK